MRDLHTQSRLTDALARLAAQRRANQIGVWEFEDSKRRLLNMPRSRFPNVIRNLLACLIVNLVLLGLAIAFPTYAKMVLIALLIIVGFLLVAGWHVFSEVTIAGRRGGGPTRAVDWDHGMAHVAKTGFTHLGIFNKPKD